MEPGTPYNPRDFWTGCPKWLVRLPKLCPGSKLLFDLLAEHAGHRMPRAEDLAAELGVSVRQVHYYLSALRGSGLVSAGVTVCFIWQACCELQTPCNILQTPCNMLPDDLQTSGSPLQTPCKILQTTEAAPPFSPLPPVPPPPISPKPVERLTDTPEPIGPLNLGRALFGYFGGAPQSSHTTELADAVRLWSDAGRVPSQTDLVKACLAARKWWVENKGGIPKTMGPVLKALNEVLGSEAGEGTTEPKSLDAPPEVWEAYALKLCGWDRSYWQELESHMRTTLVRDAKRTWRQLHAQQPAGGAN